MYVAGNVSQDILLCGKGGGGGGALRYAYMTGLVPRQLLNEDNACQLRYPPVPPPCQPSRISSLGIRALRIKLLRLEIAL